MNSNSFIQVRVQKKYFFEFDKMIEFFQVCSPAQKYTVIVFYAICKRNAKIKQMYKKYSLSVLLRRL